MTEGVRTSLNREAVAGPIIALATLPDGVPTELEAEIDGIAESVILFRSGDTVRAWLNICPHAGRRLDWAPGRFLLSKAGQLVCAAHGATFELGAGECIAGPCRGQSLRAVPLKVIDGAVHFA